MFDFHFAYSDGNTYDVTGVTKVFIKKASNIKELEGDEILTSRLPLDTMYLYSSAKNVTISGTNLLVIDVLKKDS